MSDLIETLLVFDSQISHSLMKIIAFYKPAYRRFFRADNQVMFILAVVQGFLLPRKPQGILYRGEVSFLMENRGSRPKSPKL